MSATQTVHGPRSGWNRSSKSNDGPNCVEVKFDGDQVLIRDSKYLRDPSNDPAKQPILTVARASWEAFLRVAVGGENTESHDLPVIERHATGEVSLGRAHVILNFTPAEWHAFTGGVLDGEFAAA